MEKAKKHWGAEIVSEEVILEMDPSVSATLVDGISGEQCGWALPEFLTHKIMSKVKLVFEATKFGLEF